MVDPIDYTRGNGFGQGLQLAGLYQDVQQRRAQAEQEQQQQQAMQQFQSDWQGAYASGDPKQMDALVAKYPGQMEIIKNGLGLRNSQHQQAVNDMANDFAIARQVGTPQAIAQAISKHPDTLKSIGATPEEAMQMAVSDPNGFDSLVHAVRLSTMAPDKQIESQQNQQKIDETIRNNNLENDRVIRGQNLTYQSAMTGHSIAQQNVNLRRMELDDKKYDRQIARETNDLKLADLQDKRAKNQQDIEQARRDKADAYNTSMDAMSRTVETAQKVLDSPGFNGYFGVNLNPLSNRFIPGTDAADTSALVDTLKSQGFMSGIQQMRGLGALSNAEGQKVMDAIGNLSASQSEASAKASIKAIISTTQKAQERLQQKYGKDIPPIQNAQQAPAAPAQQANSGYQSLWGD
ncbi:TPA: phage DNA ejection protein [Serratia marcescens]|nr:phage DNA ejection protein [Serratia marcescens]